MQVFHSRINPMLKTIKNRPREYDILQTCSSNDRQRLSKNRGRGRNLSDYTIMATSRGSDQTKYKSAKSSKISRTYIFQFAQDHLNQQKFNRNFESFYKISLGK